MCPGATRPLSIFTAVTPLVPPLVTRPPCRSRRLVYLVGRERTSNLRLKRPNLGHALFLSPDIQLLACVLTRALRAPGSVQVDLFELSATYLIMRLATGVAQLALRSPNSISNSRPVLHRRDMPL